MTDDPLFPDGIGEVLCAVLNPEPEPGPPYVHTIEPPRCDLEDCCDTGLPCECACHRVQPTHTATWPTVADIADMIEREDRYSMFGLCPQGHLRRARTHTGTFGQPDTEIYCPTCEADGDD